MTLQIGLSLPTAKLETLIDETLRAKAVPTLYSGVFKRVLDVLLVLLVGLPALLIIGVFSLLVARDGHSPFYFQERLGRNGRVFLIWKLRSMVPDADNRLQMYLASNPAARAEWDVTQKLRNDPRVTKVGRFIRKTSIDELPQLWNVLRGDMSLVGPRPMMPCQQQLYLGTAYYALRPGITGYWQVSVRNESSFEQRAGFDTAYLKQLSFLNDLRVLFKTVRVVLRGTGC